MIEIIEDYLKIRENVRNMVFDYIYDTNIPTLVRCDILLKSGFGEYMDLDYIDIDIKNHLGKVSVWGNTKFCLSMTEIIEAMSQLTKEEDYLLEKYYQLLEQMLVLGAIHI